MDTTLSTPSSNPIIAGLPTFADFLKTGVEMPAKEYGQMIKDSQWDEPESEATTFRVYMGTYYLELCQGRSLLLTLGNQSWITGELLTQRDLEYRLWKYAISEIAQDLLRGASDETVTHLLQVIADTEAEVEIFDKLGEASNRLHSLRGGY